MKQYRLIDTGSGSRARAVCLQRSTVREKVKAVIPMALYMLFYCTSFMILENWNRQHYTVIHTAVDDRIPFCEWFVIPYFLWFVYIVGFTLYVFVHDEKCYHETCTFLAIGMTVFLIVSVFFPNILYLRPRVLPRSNILTDLCRFLYAIDTPTNVTPSIHVYNSLAIMIGVWHTNKGVHRYLWSRIAVTFQGFLIILATMFIKQHSFSDVVLATWLAIVSYILVYKLGFVAAGKKTEESQLRSLA